MSKRLLYASNLGLTVFDMDSGDNVENKSYSDAFKEGFGQMGGKNENLSFEFIEALILANVWVGVKNKK
jgi:hypothetical protein